MKKTGIGLMILTGGALAAATWSSDFSNGMDEWVKNPRSATIAEVIDDADATRGKALKIAAENRNSGVNSPVIPVPAGTEGQPWTVEFDIRSEGNMVGSCSAMVQYVDANGKMLGQSALSRPSATPEAFGWKHVKATIGTGRRAFPEGTAGVRLRFSFWNKTNTANGTIVVDNVTIVSPRGANAEWFSDFSNGMDEWVKNPRSATIAEVIDDADAARGKALKIAAENRNSGVNSPVIPVPAGTEGQPWTVEFDIRSEGNMVGTCSAMVQYVDANGKMLGQSALSRPSATPEAFGWKHVKATIGTGRRAFPEGTAGVRLRFSFWNKTNTANGTIAVDNVKIVPPAAPAAANL